MEAEGARTATTTRIAVRTASPAISRTTSAAWLIRWPCGGGSRTSGNPTFIPGGPGGAVGHGSGDAATTGGALIRQAPERVQQPSEACPGGLAARRLSTSRSGDAPRSATPHWGQKDIVGTRWLQWAQTRGAPMLVSRASWIRT